MKDKDLACLSQGMPQVFQTRIGERIRNIHTHIGEITALINTIADQVYVVSGMRLELKSDFRELETDNIAEDLTTIEHNLHRLSDNLRTCVETLGESL